MPRRTRSRAPDQQDFITRLKYCAGVVGTQNGLADKADIPQSTLRGYLLRGVEPQRDALVRIAKAADVSLEWLATGNGPRELNARNADSLYGVHDDLRGLDPIIAAAATTLNVPLEFARIRLVGSHEMQSVVRALDDWAVYVTIPMIGDRRCAGVLLRTELESILPAGCNPSEIAAAKIVGHDLEPRFRNGDLGLFDTGAKIENGPYCMINRGGAPEFVVIEINPAATREVTVKPVGGNVDFTHTTYLPNVESFLRIHRVAGRLVGAMRFITGDSSRKS